MPLPPRSSGPEPAIPRAPAARPLQMSGPAPAPAPGVRRGATLTAPPRGRTGGAGAGAAGLVPGPAVRIWINAASGEEAGGAAEIAAALARLRPSARTILTVPAAPGSAGRTAAPPSHESDAEPEVFLPAPGAAETGQFLARHHPDLLIHLGLPIDPALVRGVGRLPQIAANVALARPRGLVARLWRPPEAAVLARMAALHVLDAQSAEEAARLRLPPATVAGRVTATPAPLSASEAERRSLSTLLRARPVWAAMGVPAGEEAAIFAAQAAVLRHAHRTLLIFEPEEMARGPELLERLAAEDWNVAARWREGEPGAETEIFLTDDPAEAGLWYRLAPVAVMGGTLFGKGRRTRSPMEAAALGSAILHGPNTQAHAEDYARIEAARASRRIASAGALGEAVADLLSPDRAAMLAHNAWAMISGGAGVALDLARAALARLDAARAGAA